MLRFARRFILAAAISAASMSISIPSVKAQPPDTSWNVASGSWFDDTNWTSGVPTSTERAEIDNGGISLVQLEGAAANVLDVGERNLGELRVEAGGTISNTLVFVGDFSTSEGAVMVDGDGSNWSVGSLWLGSSGRGTLAISNGGRVFSQSSTYIGREENSQGNVLVTGQGSEWVGGASRNIYIGYEGSGKLRIENGGHVTNKDTTLAWWPGSEGTAIVTGESTVWNCYRLIIARRGKGTATISDGARVSGEFGEIWSPEGLAVVTDPGSNWAIGFLLDVFNGGTLSIQNGGHVTVDYATNIHEGDVYLESGTITSDLLRIFSLGVLRGSGIAQGDVTNSGIIAPGTSVGTLNIHGSYSQFSGELQIELASPTSFDTLAIDGLATLDGTLEASLLDGFVPDLGDAFEILTATDGVIGTFSSHLLPALTDDLVWSIHYGSNSVRLEVETYLAGDYNQNGIVDAADYTVWRDGTSGEFEQHEYDAWSANFGAVIVSSSGGNTLVPEAASWQHAILALVAAGLTCHSRGAATSILCRRSAA
ncbi:MAG: hypothetical protein WD851_14965 [Pirellulales bacterium]